MDPYPGWLSTDFTDFTDFFRPLPAYRRASAAGEAFARSCPRCAGRRLKSPVRARAAKTLDTEFWSSTEQGPPCTPLLRETPCNRPSSSHPLNFSTSQLLSLHPHSCNSCNSRTRLKYGHGVSRSFGVPRRQALTSSHLHIFISSYLLIFSSSHLLILSTSQLLSLHPQTSSIYRHSCHSCNSWTLTPAGCPQITQIPRISSGRSRRTGGLQPPEKHMPAPAPAARVGD